MHSFYATLYMHNIVNSFSARSTLIWPHGCIFVSFCKFPQVGNVRYKKLTAWTKVLGWNGFHKKVYHFTCPINSACNENSFHATLKECYFQRIFSKKKPLNTPCTVSRMSFT